MKKRITAVISVMFALLMMLSLVVPAFAADNKLLYTDVDTFTAEEQKEISDYLYEKSESVDCDIVCICLSSFETYKDGKYTKDTIKNIAEDYYTENNIGRGADGNAVIAIWVDDAGSDGFDISVFGTKYTQEEAKIIFAETFSRYAELGGSLEENNYYLLCMAFADGFEAASSGQEYVTEVDENGNVVIYHKEDYNKSTFNWVKYIIIAVVIGAIIGFVVATIMKSNLKSVRKQSGAANYVVEDSFKVETKNDVFLYKKVDKTAKPKQQQPPKK